MAAYTWVGVTDNWSTSTNWLPIAPAGGPTSADTVTINNAQPCTVTANSSCLTIIFTGYTSTFKINSGFTLTVFGTAITLGAGMVYDQTTTGILSTRGNQTAITIIFAGITIPNLTSGKTTAATVQTVTISGVAPTIKNFVCLSSTSNASLALAGAILTITNSFAMTGGVLTGITPTFSGSVNMTQTGGAINTGFTVSAGSTLTLGSNITSISGNIVFAPGSFFVPSTNTVTLTGISTLDSSGVTWYNLSLFYLVGSITLTSDLNIGNDLYIGINNFSIGFLATSTKNINVQGSVTGPVYYARNIAFSNIILNLIGTGTYALPTLQAAPDPVVVNINTSNPAGYIIGSSSFTGANTMQLITISFNLVGTSAASAFSGTTLYLSASTLDTNRTSVGGSNPIYSAITVFTTATFITDTTCLGNLTLTSGVSSGSVNGAKVSFGGNLIYSISAGVFGTSTLEFIGSNAATWTNGIYQNNIVVNKSGGAVVTTGTAITWGAAGRSLTMNTAVNFATNSNTLTLSGTPLTIVNNFPSNSFFNINIPAITLNINGSTLLVAGTLLCSSSATFAGTYGFTTQNFTCTVAALIITFQNINANPLAEYTVNGVLTLIGTSASRIILQAAGSATFNGTINPVGQLNYLSGTIPSIGMTLSQATLASPAQLDPTNRPVITGGVSPTFTITPAAGAIIGTTLSMRAGYKAKFTLTNGTGSQNVAYTTTQDIDSNAGATITSFGSYSDSIGQPSANLFRTLNWGPLIAPSGSVYYTFVT